jgi:hypothetical protein
LIGNLPHPMSKLGIQFRQSRGLFALQAAQKVAVNLPHTRFDFTLGLRPIRPA